jgi:hypothetical protein
VSCHRPTIQELETQPTPAPLNEQQDAAHSQHYVHAVQQATSQVVKTHTRQPLGSPCCARQRAKGCRALLAALPAVCHHCCVASHHTSLAGCLCTSTGPSSVHANHQELALGAVPQWSQSPARAPPCHSVIRNTNRVGQFTRDICLIGCPCAVREQAISPNPCQESDICAGTP